MQVSEKAPTCPKCGAIIAYPPFYTTVERDGLNISTALCDWWNEFLDDSAFGSGQPIQCLSHRSDDVEMAELTIKNRRKLMDAMSNRMMQLPKKSAEAKTLDLTIKYVVAAADFAIIVRGCCHSENRWDSSMLRQNIALNLERLEAIKAGCSNEDDLKLMNGEIEACKAFGVKFQAGRNDSAKLSSQSVSPQTSSGKSGCLILLVVIVAVTLSFAGAVFAFAR